MKPQELPSWPTVWPQPSVPEARLCAALSQPLPLCGEGPQTTAKPWPRCRGVVAVTIIRPLGLTNRASDSWMQAEALFPGPV